MPEIGMSGLMSGDENQGDLQSVPALILDSTWMWLLPPIRRSAYPV
jgi:hypothetical protein